MSKTTDFQHLLRVSAESRRYPFPERAAIWEERLQMHLKDLDSVLRASAPGDMLTLPPKAKLEIVPPSGTAAAPSKHSDDLAFASAGEIATRVRRHELSPFEVARAFVERADAQRALHAFITLRPETVLREARQLETRLQAGEDLGPLAGVPVAVKDLARVKGYPLTCGTKAMPGDEASGDADVVVKLRAAGALIIGTTNLHELAYGVTSANAHFGHVVNPTAPGHVPGGSSGGSASAVAAGLAAIAVGTDTGGSIRIPAACCGIVGFKGTHEVVSRAGVWALADTLDHIGPLARSVTDAALGFEVMAGLPSGCISQKVIGQPRLVRPAPFFYDTLDDAIRSRIEAVLDRLQGAGARLEERRIDAIELAPAAQFMTLCVEACQSNWALLIEHADGISPDVRLRLEVGQFIGAIDYVKAQKLRRQLRDNMIGALKDADVLVLPTLAVSIPKQGISVIEFGGRKVPLAGTMTRLTGPFNSAGMPALSIPCGTDSGGLPVALQLVGRPGADATVLAVGKWVESVLAG
jgi:aspartyl-tRNA(Asn)/glutamyl-tRNA(Gln) amidotransferase subunit A